MRILDIDLDFFVSPIAHFISGKERLSEDSYTVDSPENVRAFIEEKCGLSRSMKTPGNLLEEHDEVFDLVRCLGASGQLNSAIDLDHVDAHSDAGYDFTGSWAYICTEYLHLPQDGRLNPVRGQRGLNSGNFIIFLAACGWLKSVTFVYPPNWRPDVPEFHMKSSDITSGALQLRKIKRADHLADLHVPIATLPCELEPEIPFHLVHRGTFRAEAPYDLVFLTRSPGFTTKSADAVYGLISEYIQPKQ